MADTMVSRVAIPNAYRGTKADELKSPGNHLIGSRIVHEEYFGTIHYVGGLPKSKGVWVGVDWDDPTRGRHDGIFGGVRYFLPHSDTSGSFVRPEKLSEGTILEEALFYRYVVCPECQLSVQLPPVGGDSQQSGGCLVLQATDTPGRLDGLLLGSGGCNSPSEAEFTGVPMDTSQPVHIELFTSQTGGAWRHANCIPEAVPSVMARLTSVCLSIMPVNRCLHLAERVPVWPRPGGCLGELLSRLVDLDLSGCLLSRWTDLAEICVQLPNLEVLNVSGNRLRLPRPPDSDTGHQLSETDANRLRLRYDLDNEPDHADRLLASAFQRLSKLVVIRNQVLDWPGLCRLLVCMPCLRSLVVAYNNLGNPEGRWSDHVVSAFHQLIELDLTCTGLIDLANLFAVIGPSPVLSSLVLSQNAVSDWPSGCVGEAGVSASPSVGLWFPSLNSLGLRATSITSWSAVRHLLHLPKLVSLIMSDCPLLEPLTFETAQQELIARLPLLTLLNRMQVTGDERRGAELDYLKRHGAAWHDASKPVGEENASTTDRLSGFQREHPTFAQLCEKYGAPELGETKLVSKALKEGLVTVTFECRGGLQEDTPSESFSRRIPVRMPVGRLRTLARRLFRLPAKASFDLFVQGDRHRRQGAAIELECDTREVAYYSVEDGDTVYLRFN